MPSFSAAGIVEPLDFNFSNLPNCPPGLADAKGDIPEPSPEQVASYNAKARMALARVRSPDLLPLARRCSESFVK